MEQAAFKTLVARAMLAPSAHNTQPARWALREGEIEVFADLSRRLPVGDPGDRDLEVSCGAAVEGTVLALAAMGQGAEVALSQAPVADGLRPIARIRPKDDPAPEDVALSKWVGQRVTHRKGFAPAPGGAFTGWTEPHLTLVTDPGQIAWLAKSIDIASARIMRDRPFRRELLDWMRLRPSHPDYHRDGLNREVLAIDPITARLIPGVLRGRLYEGMSRLGLGPQLSGEAGRSRKASAIALFHWPAEGAMIEAGRAFYRSWLTATARGLAGWPAAALADDPATRAEVSKCCALPVGRVLFNALRLGGANGPTPSRARLSPDEVVL